MRRRLVNILPEKSEVNAFALLPDGQHLVAAYADQTLKVWNIKTRHITQTITIDGHPASNVCVVPSGKKVVSVSNHWNSSENILRVFELTNGKELLRIPACSGPLSLSPDGKRAICVTKSKKHPIDVDEISVWNLENGKLTQVIETQAEFGGVSSLALTPDGQQIVVGYWFDEPGISGNFIQVRKVDDGKKLLHFFSKKSLAIVITSDGRHAVSSVERDSHKVALWEIHTGRIIAQFDDLELYLTKSGMQEQSLKDKVSAELKKGTLINRGAHGDSVCALAITLDGKRLISGSKSFDSLKVWDMRTGELLYREYGNPITSLILTPDGQHVIHTDGAMLMIWKLPEFE